MTTVTWTTANPASSESDALVLAAATSITTDEPAELLGVEDIVDRHTKHKIVASFGLWGVTGKPDNVVKIPAPESISAEFLVITGVGEAQDSKITPEQLRRAAGAAARNLKGVSKAVFALPITDGDDAQAVAEGSLLGSYQYTKYKSAQHTPAASAPIENIAIVGGASASIGKSAVEKAQVVADAVALARDLVNCPPNDLFPESFAQKALTAAKTAGVKTTVWDEKMLAAEKCGGILAVGQGSSRPPRLVVLSWSPRGAKKHLALVGKGITFDTGGISLKPAAGMEAMKTDMAGAAAVLGAMTAIAKSQLPLKVTAYLCLAENMPSGTAQRPSDVITIRGGKTVEVLNTDAEGRLVMADGLVLASETTPDAIIDIATLTGAQMVALGDRVSAVMGSDTMRNDVRDAATSCGERFWPMPLPDDLRPAMDSPTADIANIGDRMGGMLSAGLFLKEFVGFIDTKKTGSAHEQIPWAHLDIAGPSATKEAYGYNTVGGTGVGVRTLLTFAQSMS